MRCRLKKGVLRTDRSPPHTEWKRDFRQRHCLLLLPPPSSIDSPPCPRHCRRRTAIAAPPSPRRHHCRRRATITTRPPSSPSSPPPRRLHCPRPCRAALAAPPLPRYRHRRCHCHHGEGIASLSVNWLYPPSQEGQNECPSPLYGSQSLGCWVSPLPSTWHCFGCQCLALRSTNIITNGCNPCRLSWCRPSCPSRNYVYSHLYSTCALCAISLYLHEVVSSGP